MWCPQLKTSSVLSVYLILKPEMESYSRNVFMNFAGKSCIHLMVPFIKSYECTYYYFNLLACYKAGL